MSDFFYNAIRRDIVMIKNDTLTFGFEIQGLEGQSPDNIVFSCKDTPDKDTYLFKVDRADHITEISYDPVTDIRTYRLRIPPILTADLELGRYFYDLQINTNNDIYTLMKGRLTLEYQVTTGSDSPEPSYDNGDNVAYPRSDISQTARKVYHELPISNIAARILDINGAEETYTTTQMSAALTDIKEDISDISGAINEITGGSSEIPLADIAGVITNNLDIQYEDGSEVYY